MHPVRSPCCVFVVSVVDISMNSNRKEGSVFIPSEEGYTTNTTNQMGKKIIHAMHCSILQVLSIAPTWKTNLR